MKRVGLLVALLAGLCLGSAAALAGEESATQPTVQQQIDALRVRQERLETELEETRDSLQAALASVESAQSKAVQGAKVKISGYVQTQWTNDEAADPKTDFRVRRARLKLTAPVTDLAGLTLEIDASKAVELKEANLDLGRTTDPCRLRMGQAKVPFMYDVLQSSSVRLAPEQTALATTIFPGEYDIGAWVNFRNVLGDGVPGTTLDVGVMNGQGPSASEKNGNKDVVARLRFVQGWKPVDKDTESDTVYLACLHGEFTDSGKVTTRKRYLGGGFSQIVGPLWLRGEWVQGENLGHDFLGWYAQAAYQSPSTPDQVFARYELFDEDRDTDRTDFKSLTVGYQRELDTNTRLVLAHEFRSPDAGYSKFSKTDGDLSTVRVQVKY